MSDLFREIDDELRRDRAMEFLARYGLWVFVGALALIASITTTTILRDINADKNAALTARLIAITGSGLYGNDTRPDTAALAEFGKTAKGDLAVLAQLRQAGLLARDGKDDDAIKVYQHVIDQPGVDPVLRNYARYLQVLRRTDHDKPDDLIAALKPLAEDKIWGPAAQELTGVLEFRAGRVERSLAILEGLMKDPTTQAGIRTRAGQLADLYRQSLPTPPTPPNS